MSEDEENVQNESEEQFKIEDLDDIYKSQDILENEFNQNKIQDDSMEDNANYNYISNEIKSINEVNNKKEEPNNQDDNNDNIINMAEEINYNQVNYNNIINNENNNIINKNEP